MIVVARLNYESECMDRPPGQNEVALVERKTVKVRCEIKIYNNDGTPSLLQGKVIATGISFTKCTLFVLQWCT